MNKKLSLGTRFVLLSIIVFFVFLALTGSIYRYTAIRIEQNMSILTLLAGSYFFVQLILFLVVFKSYLPKSNFSWDNILTVSLFFLLISTVLSVNVSITATVLFVVLAVLFAIVKKKHFQPHPLFYFMAAYYLFQYVGLLWSIDTAYGWRFVGRGLSFIVLPLAFGFYSVSEEKKNLLLRIFFRFLEVYLLMVIVAYFYQVQFHKVDFGVGFHLKKNYFSSPVPPGVDYYLLLGWAGYNHPTFVSFILTLMFGIEFYLWRNDNSPQTVKISGFEMGFYGFMTAVVILLLQSRIGMIMFPFGIFLTLLYSLRKKKKLVLSAVVFSCLLVLSAGFYIYKNYRGYFYDRPREIQTDIVLSFLKDHYLLGTGTGGMKVLIPWFPTAHNQFLGDLFHLGIPGLLLLLSLMGSSFYFACKDKNFLLLYFLLIYFVMMQIEMPLSLQKGITYFTLFTGLLLKPRPFGKETK
ncbi:MAG TPA: hypothetical protein PKV22_04255 [Paludibacteraceae bacterium]|nr:hypothetical protein [Paludibacteraceae bacterium]